MQPADFEAHRRTVRGPDGDVSYVDIGSGPVAVFVHGIGLNARFWRNVVEAVRDERRCVAIDLPLHGHSAARPGQDLSLPALARAIEAVRADVGAEAIDLVGNDTGGALAQLYAAAHPERLRSLALTNCEADGNIPAPAFQGAVDAAARGEFAPRVTAAYRNLDGLEPGRRPLAHGWEHPQRVDIDTMRSYLAPLAGTLEAARQFERLLTSLDPAHLRAAEPGLRALAVPTLIAWGTADDHFDVAWAHWLRDTIPGAELVELPGARLFFPDERADELVPLLRKLWTARGEPRAV
ncbi:MAG TPA: alpha/beta hydrolase [Dactylosporangium sp.]|nr:alpha/beta hydrolase [Dactylosporangium sp.]